MNFGFKYKLKDIKSFNEPRDYPTSSKSAKLISIMMKILVGIALLFGFIAYIALNTFWIVFIGMIIAEIFGYTHPVFSVIHLSIIGTPILIALGGIFSFLITFILMVIAEKLDEMY